ncbi:MAG: hypothetical protein ACYSUI_15135 [Planctomycetota bacterium]|jgi:hypothetical protein
MAVFGSCLLALVLCEIFLWLAAPVRFHEWMIWEAEGHIRGRAMPNQVVRTATGHDLRINRHGFRGPDYEFEKAPGTLRLEVFGGSAAFCYKAAGRGKSWPGAVERKLGERLAMPVEVINLALPAYNVFNSKINYLCFGRVFKPDALIVYHTWNDMVSFRKVAKTPYRPVSTHENKPLWARIGRMTQLGRRARHVTWKLSQRRLEREYYSLDEETKANLDQPVGADVMAWERQSFEDFVRLARGDGVLPILVSQAFLGSLDNLDEPDVQFYLAGTHRRVGMSLRRAVQTFVEVCSMIQEVAREGDAIFADGYNAVPHDLQHIRDNVHLFDAGSEVLAEEIAGVLLNDARFMRLVHRVKAEAGSSVE